MSKSEEEKRLRKLRRDKDDKYDWDEGFDDRPPKGRHEKHKKKDFEDYDED